MMNGLIGYTGFVGGNIDRQGVFEKKYNSRNIEQIRGEEFDVLVCAGANALKWWSNQHPDEDIRNINSLIDPLKHVKSKRFILISTVDVYADPVDVFEDTPIEPKNLMPYGKNRYILEQFVEERFEQYHIVRLPGLFGYGLKKNVIYDFCNNNEVEKIHSEAVYQFYNLDRIWSDILTAVKNEIPLINFATEPIIVKELIAEAFEIVFDNKPYEKPPVYNMKTRYAKLYDAETPYLMQKDEIVNGVINYVKRVGTRNETGHI